MEDRLEIRPLRRLDMDAVRPVLSGYESAEKYTVEWSDSAERTRFEIRLVRLKQSYRKSFAEDIQPEDLRRYEEYLAEGFSFGAYAGGRLAALAIAEAERWNRSLRVWEFHVAREYRRQGVGRALMERVLARAAEEGLRIVYLETQNTNVPAIRFYRAMGFRLEALDLSFYTNRDLEDGEVAFFMKRRLE